MSTIVSKRVVFQGKVQGVGFRRKVLAISADFAVCGYVKNMPTGEVELIAEGEAEELEAFLNQVNQRLAQFLSGSQADDIPPQFFSDFRIES